MKTTSTLGLVKMSARMIENHWLSDDFRNVMRLHLHSRVEFIGTLMEGLLAVSRDGRIVGANRTALDHLGLSGAAAGLLTTGPLLLFAAAVRRLTMTTLGFLQYLAPTLQFLVAVLLFGEEFTQAHQYAFAAIWAAVALYTLDSLRGRKPLS